MFTPSPSECASGLVLRRKTRLSKSRLYRPNLGFGRESLGAWSVGTGAWGQTGSFPYSESPPSLSVKLVLSNKYQRTFRLSPRSVPEFPVPEF